MSTVDLECIYVCMHDGHMHVVVQNVHVYISITEYHQPSSMLH